MYGRVEKDIYSIIRFFAHIPSTMDNLGKTCYNLINCYSKLARAIAENDLLIQLVIAKEIRDICALANTEGGSVNWYVALLCWAYCLLLLL